MINVLQPGTFTTVQDFGRFGYQRFGVPESGAVDRLALRCANLLVGNPENSPLLEATLFGPRLQFDSDTIIAVTGGDLGPLLDQEPIRNWSAINVAAGSVLSFEGPRSGARAYVSFGGGLSCENLEMVMGSASTYVPGTFGGLEGRALMQGDTLYVGKPSSPGVAVQRVENPPTYTENSSLRILLGPQHNLFPEESIATLDGGQYTVSVNSDRMGIRLEGSPLIHNDSADVVSDGTAFGAIQVPGDGLPIILSADRGTTGGYAKIGTVITADHGKMAQLVPGNTVSFHIVSKDVALKALMEQEILVGSLKQHSELPIEVLAGSESISVATEEGELITFPTGNITYVANVQYGDSSEEIEVELRGP